MRRAASWGYGRATGATPQQGTPPSGGGNGGGGAGAGLGSISSQSHSSAEINAERKEIDVRQRLPATFRRWDAGTDGAHAHAHVITYNGVYAGGRGALPSTGIYRI